MKKELIQINTDALIKAYKESSNDCKNTLESLFGEELFKPKDITERIKTFDDAYKALGESHPYVVQYDQIFACLMDGEEEIPKDIIAYLKLRIIAAALNEGWEPQFTKKEKRYSPCFVSYTQKEIGETDEEQKSHVAFRSSQQCGCECRHCVYEHDLRFIGRNCEHWFSACLQVKRTCEIRWRTVC